MNDSEYGSYDSRPLYVQIRERIVDHLIRGTWLPGAPLPSETALSETYGVSVGTLRRAVDELVKDGILVRKHGRGTFVATYDRARILHTFFPMRTEEGDSRFPHSELLYFRMRKASADAAKKLRIAEGSPVIAIRNRLTMDGVLLQIDELTLPKELFPDLTEAAFKARTGSIYELYQTRYQVHVVKTADQITAVPADSETADLLEIEKDHALLEINRIAFSYYDVPVEWRVSLVNTTKHHFYTETAG